MRTRTMPEQGASLVEFALIVPLLAMLLLGTITGGLTLSRQNAVQNAVREATRFAAVSPTNDPDMAAYLGRVLDQVTAAATGDLAPNVGGRALCAAFIKVNPTGPPTITSLQENASGSRTAGTSACFTETSPPNFDRVQVSAQRRSEIAFVIGRLEPTITARSVTRYER